jgi:DNA processing protein
MNTHHHRGDPSRTNAGSNRSASTSTGTGSTGTGTGGTGGIGTGSTGIGGTGTAADLPVAAWLLALASLPGVGPARLSVLAALGDAAGTWSALVAAKGSKADGIKAAGSRAAGSRADWSRADGVQSRWEQVQAALGDPARAWALASAAADVDVAALWSRHVAAGVGVCVRGSPAWPDEAFATEQVPPELLLWKGDLDGLAGARVAIVGTRSCTRYGTEIAHDLGRELAAAGVAVVSGLAAGIDAAAHRGALAVAGAPPIAVVGSGPDVVYPRANAGLWDQIVHQGLLLTEAPLGTRPEPWRFPQRNRIIAALADVVVVVESHQRGGAVVTARHAAAQGRALLAVPGSVHSPSSEGCHDLLADGASVCRGPSDVLLALGMSPGCRRRATEDRAQPDPSGQRVLAAMDWRPASLDGLAEVTGLPLAEVALALDDLRRMGWVQERGGWFERVARRPGVPGLP